MHYDSANEMIRRVREGVRERGNDPERARERGRRRRRGRSGKTIVLTEIVSKSSGYHEEWIGRGDQTMVLHFVRDESERYAGGLNRHDSNERVM